MLMWRTEASDSSSRRGQGLVEFALIAPILVLILLAIFQFGWILTTQIGLTNSIRDAARFAASNPTLDPVQAATNVTATSAQLNLILPRNVSYYATGSATTGVSFCEYRDPNNKFAVRVRVTVGYRHPLFIPVISQILDLFDGVPDNAFLIGAVEEMRVENSPPLTGTTGLPSC